MEILTLGFSRAGTDSLHVKLEELGYNYVYHGFDHVGTSPERAKWAHLWEEGGKVFSHLQ